MAEKEAKPLSLEAPNQNVANDKDSFEMDIDVNRKQQETKTVAGVKDNSFLKKILETPKERPGGEENDPASTVSSSSPLSSAAEPSEESSSSQPKEDIRAVKERLLSEEKTYESEGVTLEECEDTADFFIELVDTILLFLIQLYSMDSSDREYQIEEKKKNKLKKHLAKLLVKMGKRYPMGIMFIVFVLACYGPMLRKAHQHRKNVQEERAAKAAEARAKAESEAAAREAARDTGTGGSGGGGRRRRRASDNIEDAEFTEEIK